MNDGLSLALVISSILVWGLAYIEFTRAHILEKKIDDLIKRCNLEVDVK